MGFPTKNDHFGVFWGLPPFSETPIWRNDIRSNLMRIFQNGSPDAPTIFWMHFDGSERPGWQHQKR